LHSDRYYELEGFHDRVFEDKRQELLRLLRSIGATHVREKARRRSIQEHSVTAEQSEDVGASKFGFGLSGARSSERRVSERRQVSQFEAQEYDLHPVKAPHIPDDLVWYPHEPKWQGIAQDALAGRLKKVKVRLEYREDFSINSRRMEQLESGLGLFTTQAGDFSINSRRMEQLESGLGLFTTQAGVRWTNQAQERLREQMDTVWEYSASFGGAAAPH
jgi:hypothetical protein